MRANIHFIVGRLLLLSLCLLLSYQESRGQDSKSEAGVIAARYGSVSLALRKPAGMCALSDDYAFDAGVLTFQKESQKSVDNRLLAFIADCSRLARFRRGANQPGETMGHWLIVVSSPYTEKIYKLSREQYVEAVAKLVAGPRHARILEQGLDKARREIEFARSKLDGTLVLPELSGEPLDLGLLGVTDSVHTGTVMELETHGVRNLIGLVSSMTLIKGVAVTYYFYRPYKDQSTITGLVEEAKRYSVELITRNK